MHSFPSISDASELRLSGLLCLVDVSGLTENAGLDPEVDWP